eukprot:Nitzschia sp. Nitz4//scaffold41_size133979//52647//54070//NITZ4_003344-RA/size133979-snap-gene-0.121-mRNA-1//-1//CDS//3329551461//530//frame0
MLSRRYHTPAEVDYTTSRDDVRRQLFVATPPRSARSALRRATSLTGDDTRLLIGAFICTGVCFVLLVHIYLLYNMAPASPSSNQHHVLPSSPQIVRTNAARPAPESSVLPSRYLQSLSENDWNQYTIRINTWRRPEQLLQSIKWHSQCPGVAQIQVVWCDPDNEPPEELQQYENVVVERHEQNSLNERFRILLPTPTIGILSIDDDVIRPCEAIDAGFFKWTKAPDRMVGFDARLHVESSHGTWKYGYMSTTEKANQYTMSLTRYCFLHRDYLYIYTKELPATILDRVATNFNCEDIAMSFLVSSLTQGKPPLLADTWAIKSMLKMYVDSKISGGNDHKRLRDQCVDDFAGMLGLKSDHGTRRLKPATLYHKDHRMQDCGDEIAHPVERNPKGQRELDFVAMKNRWRESDKTMQQEVRLLVAHAGHNIYSAGLVEKTDKWKQRFHPSQGKAP